MSERLLDALIQQALLFSLAVAGLALARPLLRRLGAGAVYAACCARAWRCRWTSSSASRPPSAS